MTHDDNPSVFDKIQMEIDEINIEIMAIWPRVSSLDRGAEIMTFYEERRRLGERKEWLDSLLHMDKTDAVIYYMLGQEYIPDTSVH